MLHIMICYIDAYMMLLFVPCSRGHQQNVGFGGQIFDGAVPKCLGRDYLGGEKLIFYLRTPCSLLRVGSL